MTRNSVHYELTETKVFIEGEGIFVSYGVRTTNLPSNITINDISTIKSKVEEFVELCNKNDVSVLTLRDLIEDYFF